MEDIPVDKSWMELMPDTFSLSLSLSLSQSIDSLHHSCLHHGSDQVEILTHALNSLCSNNYAEKLSSSLLSSLPGASARF